MVVSYLTDVVLLDHGMKENSTLSSVIENHLTPGPWNKLKPFCTEQLDSLKFFICKYPKVTFPARKRIDCSDFGRVFPVKELEEGEIPGC
ncbi:unnamed protein product, partial [Vitis vinifera]|uniref:BCD1 alpha/beta domain-containing protein n=1 Tax=Vitis vinifera TaxID=29760 RepID=D7U9E3_VITVI